MYHLEELPATVYHEHIILGSAGLWQNVTADDAALRSHFYVKVHTLQVHTLQVVVHKSAGGVPYSSGSS